MKNAPLKSQKQQVMERRPEDLRQLLKGILSNDKRAKDKLSRWLWEHSEIGIVVKRSFSQINFDDSKEFYDNSLQETFLRFDNIIQAFCRRNQITDVIIPDLGVIEIRRVLPGETGFLIPEFVRENRLVYVAVGFDESLDFGDILGFVRLSDLTKSDGYVSLEMLQPAEKLLDYLMQLEAGRDFLLSDDPLAEEFRNINDLN
ncbi:MAG: DUF1822 family protein [Microcoleaceae cyanobacterium MO_207.B10]|nr:DUF1822 family protein [Microcoleaceae cyanobacterium MO_207.B10]